MNLSQLQAEQKEWADRNFGTEQESWKPLLGALEELGELAHAHLKASQGIRGTSEEHRAAKVDAVADVVVFLADYCSREGIDFAAAVSDTWAKVRLRDWKANPQNGQESPQFTSAPDHPLAKLAQFSEVVYTSDSGHQVATFTRSLPWRLSNGLWVVLLASGPGGFLLDRITPRDEALRG